MAPAVTLGRLSLSTRPDPAGRHVALAADGTRVTFRCPRPGCPTYVKDLGRGPVAKRLPAWWCARMLRYWGPGQGVVAGPCPKCADPRLAAHLVHNAPR